MTATSKKRIWNGPKAFSRLLVAVDALEPWPGNPRRGDIAAVRGSLERFGQVKPIVVDGSRIVAGHHVRLAAIELGWTHVAAVPNDFGSEEEARAFLLADNRTAELGVVDEEALAEQLRVLRETSTLEGTGYSTEDAEELENRLAAIRAAAGDFRRMDDPDFGDGDPPPRLDERSPSDQPFEVPLLLSKDVRRDFANWVKILEREWETRGVTDVVVRAVREAAQRA